MDLPITVCLTACFFLYLVERSFQDSALRTHLEEQVRLYGSQHIVNLVNHIGHEKPIKEAYERHVAQVGDERVLFQGFPH